MKFRSFGLSDKGKIRNSNQDAFLINEAEKLFLVADGLGGHASGEIASRMAVRVFEKGIIKFRNNSGILPVKKRNNLTEEQNRMLAAALLCNRKIIDKGQKKSSLKGMGAALLGISLEEGKLSGINIGDCRLYRIRNNKIKQLTKDQTLAAEKNRDGKISDEEARRHPQKHVLLSAAGHIDSKSKIDIFQKTVLEKDIFLICTDGLYNMVDDSLILNIISENRDKSLYQMGISLIIKANMSGGTDNITVVLISFD